MGKFWQLARSAVFAVLAGQLALAGHIIGGGHAPEPAALITITALVGAVANSLAGKHRRFPALLGAMTVSQALFHLSFMLSTHVEQVTVWATAGMIAFHGLAALMTAALLAHGEQCLSRLAAAARRIVARIVAAFPVAVPPPWIALLSEQGFRQLASVTTGSNSRRGPPLPR